MDLNSIQPGECLPNTPFGDLPFPAASSTLAVYTAVLMQDAPLSEIRYQRYSIILSYACQFIWTWFLLFFVWVSEFYQVETENTASFLFLTALFAANGVKNQKVGFFTAFYLSSFFILGISRLAIGAKFLYNERQYIDFWR